MQALVARVEKTVLKPEPISKFKTGRLIAEIRKLEWLIEKASNHDVVSDRLRDLVKLRLQLCRTALSSRRLARNRKQLRR